MKKLVLLLAFMVPMVLFAQKSPIDKLFEKYAHQKGITTVNISGALLGFASQIDTGEEGVNDLLSELNGVRILTVENSELNKELDFYKELEKGGFFKNHNYEVLMEVTEENEVIRFYGKTAEGNKLSELLMVIGGDENVLISIRGMIDPKNIGKITNSLDIDLGDMDMDMDLDIDIDN